MQVLRATEQAGAVRVNSAVLPYREAREKGPVDVITSRGLWLTRLADGSGLDFARFGNHLVVVLSGTVGLQADGGAEFTLLPGDVLHSDVRSPDVLRARWEKDIWVLLISAPGWASEDGEQDIVRGWEPRAGRPSMIWVYDDADFRDKGYSRTEPFRWELPLSVPPDVADWVPSVGAFVTRREYGYDGYVQGVWHNGPRRQFAITLNGCAELETSDGTITRPVAGDLTLIDDATGPGHVTRGQGDRWMLFVTIAPDALQPARER